MASGRIRRFVFALLALGFVAASLVAGVDTEPPESFAIAEVVREATARTPAVSQLADRHPLRLAIKVRRPDLAILASEADKFTLEVFLCRQPNRTYYGSELYLDDVLIRRIGDDGEIIGDQRRLLQRQAGATARGDTATITAFVPRSETDGWQPVCAAFVAGAHHISSIAQVPPPTAADLAALGIKFEVLARPAGVSADRFAVQLVRAEASRLGLPSKIAESDQMPIAIRASAPDKGGSILVYYDPRQERDRSGSACRVVSPRPMTDPIEFLAYRRCAGLLGITPGPEPPSAAMITNIVTVVDGKVIRCPSFHDCPELDRARGERPMFEPERQPEPPSSGAGRVR